MTRRVILQGLDARDYSHPLDHEARAALEQIPGLPPLVKKANEIGIDRFMKLQSLANKIRVSERQFPHLHDLFLDTKYTLGISQHVDLFIQQAFYLNAYAAGVDYPHVTITTELINNLNEDEMRFILGHELGHVQSRHVLYSQIGMCLPMIMEIIGSATLGIGRLVGKGVEVALYDWIRKSELTADRAGLLACQNSEAVLSAFCKIAGVPRSYFEMVDLEEIQRQADEFDQLVRKDGMSKLFNYLGQMWNTHPWIIIRFSGLLN